MTYSETGPEHFRHAEQLLDAAYAEDCDSAYHRHLIGAATVHAMLAFTAATAMASATCYHPSAPVARQWLPIIHGAPP